MFITLILISIIVLLIIFLVGTISVGGALATLIFSDVIVCVIILSYIVYRCLRKKKK